MPQVDKVRHYYNHPGFVAAATDAVLAGLADLPEPAREGARLVFVTHSVPTAMDDVAGPGGHAYVRQHEDVSATVAAAVTARTGRDGAPGTSSTARARARRPSPGWSPTSTTTCGTCTRAGCPASSSSRSGS